MNKLPPIIREVCQVPAHKSFVRGINGGGVGLGNAHAQTAERSSSVQ